MKKRVKKRKNIFKKNKIFNDFEFDLESDSKFSIFEVIVIVFISIIFGVIVGYFLTYSRSPISSIKDNDSLEEIVSAYYSIKENYYDDVSDDDLVNAAVEGMVNSLDDPYSTYMDSNSTSSFKESVDGYFVGVGLTIMYDEESNYNRIIEVNSSGPSNKLLKVNDLITSIDGEDLASKDGSYVSELIDGKVGTKVKITVNRNGKEKTFSIKRSYIEIENVSRDLFLENDKRIGYLDVSIVASNTYKQFNNNLKKLEKKKIDSLIIDLRDNPGGHLSQTKNILSLFFNKKTVLYQIKDKTGKKKIYSISNGSKSYPIVILVNEGSASAAEIMTSCFMENYDNISVVGEVTYGKGSVQQAHSLSTGTSIKYTIQEWLTPSGKSINGKGITPDYIVSQDSNYYSNPIYDNDTQLQKAIELLK